MKVWKPGERERVRAKRDEMFQTHCPRWIIRLMNWAIKNADALEKDHD